MLDQIQLSELETLVLAIALTPLLGWAYRGIELPRKRWIAAAITSIMCAYVATVVEGLVAEEFFNTVEHLMYAAAGICFLAISLNLNRWCRSRDEGGC